VVGTSYAAKPVDDLDLHVHTRYMRVYSQLVDLVRRNEGCTVGKAGGRNLMHRRFPRHKLLSFDEVLTARCIKLLSCWTTGGAVNSQKACIICVRF